MYRVSTFEELSLETDKLKRRSISTSDNNSTIRNAFRIESVDGLRGIAALAVCVFHFTNGNTTFFAAHSAIKSVGALGEFGVQVFFVISGFILPYAMSNSGYRFSMFPVFVKKRLVRLEPPYLAAIVLVVTLGYLSSLVPGFRGVGLQLTVRQLLSHIGYLNVVTHEPWLNPVFWTLAIEFQFYLFLGLLFPLLDRLPGHHWTFLCMFPLLAIGYFFPSKEFLFHHLSYFFIGMVVFWAKVGKASFKLSVIGFGVGVAVSFFATGIIGCLAGALVGLAIWCVSNMPDWSLHLGKISYSLYLVHVPIGMRIINLSERFSTQVTFRLLIVVIATAFSIGVATLLWRFCEKPAQTWAGKIRYAAS